MSRKQPFRIKAFPAGSWQVVWYGDLHNDAARGLYSQPSITLVLETDRADLRRRRIEVPFSLISIVPIGSIWEDGVRTIERPSEDLVNRKVDVFPGSVREFKAGARMDGATEHLLPFEPFNYHEEDTGSSLLCWTTPTGEIILVPAIEVVRFYFGTSSFLLKRIVSGQPLDDMWDAAELDPETGTARLQLAADVPRRKSSAEIARIAFDTRARQAAIQVRRSLETTAAGRDRIYPRTMFPFSKPSTLKVAGLPINTAGGKRFVVMRIDSCTGQYPYKRLTVTGGNVVKDAFSSDQSDLDQARGGSLAAADIGASDPSSTRVERSESHWEGLRFVDLARKTIEFNDVQPKVADAGGGSPANDRAFGLGDGISSGHGSPLELAGERRPSHIAFIEAEVLGDEDPHAKWLCLESALELGEPSIHPVLVATERPRWAHGLRELSFCNVAADDLDGDGHQLLAFVAWLQTFDNGEARWHVFSSVESTSRERSTVREGDSLLAVVQFALLGGGYAAHIS